MGRLRGHLDLGSTLRSQLRIPALHLVAPIYLKKWLTRLLKLCAGHLFSLCQRMICRGYNNKGLLRIRDSSYIRAEKMPGLKAQFHDTIMQHLYNLLSMTGMHVNTELWMHATQAGKRRGKKACSKRRQCANRQASQLALLDELRVFYA